MPGTISSQSVRSNISAANCAIEAAMESKHASSCVTLMAVSKTVGLEEVAYAIEAGVHDFGENRASELVIKHDAFPQENWHFIGRIQTNKLKDIVGRACMIHSVSSIHALEAIQKQASKKNLVQKVLFEVNISKEESKDGFGQEDIRAALDIASTFDNIEVCGFMTMAPLGELEEADRVFYALREFRDAMQVEYNDINNISLDVLSMGMSQDYTLAVRQGATIVRLGRSIFS